MFQPVRRLSSAGRRGCVIFQPDTVSPPDHRLTRRGLLRYGRRPGCDAQHRSNDDTKSCGFGIDGNARLRGGAAGRPTASPPSTPTDFAAGSTLTESSSNPRATTAQSASGPRFAEARHDKLQLLTRRLRQCISPSFRIPSSLRSWSGSRRFRPPTADCFESVWGSFRPIHFVGRFGTW
jgi:hypothetical protein